MNFYIGQHILKPTQFLSCDLNLDSKLLSKQSQERNIISFFNLQIKGDLLFPEQCGYPG